MAQDELLSTIKLKCLLVLRALVLLIIGCNCHTYSCASEDKSPILGNEGARELQDYIKGAKSSVIEGIRHNYAELQRMLGRTLEDASDKEILEKEFSPKGSLRVFVSSSMSVTLLKSYAAEAQKYRAVLVFKGLPDGSWQNLAKLVSDITEGAGGVAMQIDDEAFERFNINSVPAFVLSTEDRDLWQEQKPALYDRVVGNIGIGGALELIAGKGDLKEDAIAIMDRAK